MTQKPTSWHELLGVRPLKYSPVSYSNRSKCRSPFCGENPVKEFNKIGCLTTVARLWWPLSALGHKVSILWKGHNNVAPLTETWLLKPWLCTKCWQLLIAYLSQYNIPLWICEGVLPWWISKIDCCLRMGSTWSRVARGGVWKRGSCAPRPASVNPALGMSSNH